MSYDYPQDMYRNYAKSIYLEVEKKLEDTETLNPHQFAHLYKFEINKAMKRMIQITGTLRRVSGESTDQQTSPSNR